MRTYTPEEVDKKKRSYLAFHDNFGKFDFIQHAAERVLMLEIERDFWKSEVMHLQLEKRKNDRIRNID